jgi:hypothetical protein
MTAAKPDAAGIFTIRMASGCERPGAMQQLVAFKYLV